MTFPNSLHSVNVNMIRDTFADNYTYPSVRRIVYYMVTSASVLQLLSRLQAMLLKARSVNTNGCLISFMIILWAKKVADCATLVESVIKLSAVRTTVIHNQYLNNEIHYLRSPAERDARKSYTCLPIL